MAASPAEIAKAYLSSRHPRAASSVINLQRQDFREDRNFPSSELHLSKSPDVLVAPRSVIRLSEVHDPSGVGRHSTRTRGRAAIYRMSRSPYFKVDLSGRLKGNDYGWIANARPSSSQWTPSTSKTDGKQVLKRSSSVLDDDYGSFGPIRRIRQKSSLVSTSKDARQPPSSNIHASPSLYLNIHDKKGIISSQNPALDGMKHGSADLQITTVGDKIFSSDVPPAFGHVAETGRKLLEQLDKLAPSPKEKFHMKLKAKDESPYKLTTDMLNGRALKSMGDLDSSQLMSTDTNFTFDCNNDKDSQNVVFSESEQPYQIQENGPLKSSVSGIKCASTANGMSGAAISSRDVRPSFNVHSITSVAAARFQQRKPAFQMTAPENFLELEDEHDVIGASVQTISDEGETALKLLDSKASNSAMSGLGKQVFSSSKCMSDSSSISLAESSKKAYDVSYYSQKESFTFPVATDLGDYSQPPSTPTMPTPLPDKLAPQREQTVAPAFSLGSRSTDAPDFLSTANVASGPPAIKTNVESIPQATSPDRVNKLEDSNLAGGKTVADYKSKFAGVVSSGLSTFGATESLSSGASISGHSNGPVKSSSVLSPVSSSTMEIISPSQGNLFLSSSTTGAASSNNPIFSSSPSLTRSSVFSFGTGASTAGSVSLTASTSKSDSVDSEAKGVTNSLYGSFSPPAQVLSSSLIAGGSTFVASSPFSGQGIDSHALTIPSSSPSLISSSAHLAPSLLSTGSSFSSKSNGIGFSASTPPSISTFSAASNSFQNSASNIGSTEESTFGVQPAHSGNGTSLFSQSLAAPSGSSSSATMGLSNSSSVFGSSFSSPTFGLSNSSSPGFGYTAFGTDQSAKPFGSTSALSFSSSSTTTSSGTGFSFSGIGGSSLGSGFSFTSGAIGSKSSPGLSSTSPVTTSFGFSFSASAGSSSSASSTFSPADTSGLFGSSSQGSTSSVSGSVFGSSPSTGFSFGLSAPASGVASFGFGSSSGGSVFSFTSPVATTATAAPAFGMSNTAGGFSAISQNNDQMNVEDTMADDTNQAPAPVFPSFGQPTMAPGSPNFVFGSAVQSGVPPVFQFGSQQNPSVMQNQNLFQSGSNLDFAPGGSFSLGSGGGDKSGRKIVRVRRDKPRRK
ncbi:hypothetical protein AXF42_Ash007550 [Apostasia shenzhenica]|uniref:Nuclear pore complex protein NUP1 n=1 Tax=Apostasia shenzhenica TaxID=1088818 RepID=A0A2I0A5T0_9ASPA|nr:hypothetical protein AXF42_Ash007550 [Apostasia shenzhenica]